MWQEILKSRIGSEADERCTMSLNGCRMSQINAQTCTIFVLLANLYPSFGLLANL